MAPVHGLFNTVISSAATQRDITRRRMALSFWQLGERTTIPDRCLSGYGGTSF